MEPAILRLICLFVHAELRGFKAPVPQTVSDDGGSLSGTRWREIAIHVYRDLAREDFIIMQPQGRSNDEAEEVLICYNKGGFIPNIVARERRRVQTVLLEVSADLAWRFSRNMPSAIIGMRGIW